MANTLGSLSSALIIQEALSLVFTQRPILSAISRDLQPVAAKLNQTVTSRILSVPSVGNFGSGIANRSDTDVSVTLNQHKEVGYTFTAAEMNSTSRNLVQEAAMPLATAMGNAIVDSVCALYTVGNFSNATTDATPAYDSLVNMRAALMARGAQGERFCVVNSTAYAAMLQDPLINRQYKDNGPDTIADGIIPNVAGFKYITEYPALITTGNLTGFAGTKDSIVIASRVPADPRELLPNAPMTSSLEVITDPISGLSVMAQEYIDAATLSATVKLIWIYGVAVGNATCGQRLISA